MMEGGAPARVRVLPESLANQIAAGEVVERPASVVKELVENAIDAGALKISIDLEEAGRGLVRVVDDGSGMGPEDARTAVLRHATSKIDSADGLTAIATLGFRGEALPSIASVSRFVLVTRRAQDEAATMIAITGGGEARASVVAAPPGTRVEVRDLFWNVPARLKFLKTAHTETQHVVELVKGLALGYPHIRFRLGTGQRTALDFPAVRKLVERVSQVLGHATAKRLHEVELEGETVAGHPIRVRGFVSNAREAKATQAVMTTFVNGRRVRDRTLAHGIVSAFGSELAPGRFPLAVLWVHVRPEDVDVNVHPTKAEVRFQQPAMVHDSVMRAIQAMLLRRPWIPEAPLPLERHALGAQAAGPEPGELFERPRARAGATAQEVHKTELRFEPRVSPIPLASQSLLTPVGERSSAPLPLRATTKATATAAAVKPKVASPWRLAGRLGGERGLVLIEGAPGLGIVDQEAVLEQLTRARLDALGRPIAAQPLLVPARLDLTAIEAQRLAPRLATAKELGIWIEPFGGTTHQLLGLPLPAIAASPGVVLAELARAGARSDLDAERMLAVLARVTARSLCARGLDDVTVASLVEFAPRAIAGGRGIVVLTREEIARRLRIGDGSSSG